MNHRSPSRIGPNAGTLLRSSDSSINVAVVVVGLLRRSGPGSAVLRPAHAEGHSSGERKVCRPGTGASPLGRTAFLLARPDGFFVL